MQQNDQSGKASFPTFKKWSESFNIVRLTAWLLILYGLSPFAFPIIRKAIYGPGYYIEEPLGIAIFFPIFIAGILYKYLGSFWLLGSGYWLLHNNYKGIRTGGGAILWMLPVGIVMISSTPNLITIIVAIPIFLLFNAALFWCMGVAARKLLGTQHKQ